MCSGYSWELFVVSIFHSLALQISTHLARRDVSEDLWMGSVANCPQLRESWKKSLGRKSSTSPALRAMSMWRNRHFGSFAGNLSVSEGSCKPSTLPGSIRWWGGARRNVARINRTIWTSSTQPSVLRSTFVSPNTIVRWNQLGREENCLSQLFSSNSAFQRHLPCFAKHSQKITEKCQELHNGTKIFATETITSISADKAKPKLTELLANLCE